MALIKKDRRQQRKVYVQSGESVIPNLYTERDGVEPAHDYQLWDTEKNDWVNNPAVTKKMAQADQYGKLKPAPETTEAVVGSNGELLKARYYVEGVAPVGEKGEYKVQILRQDN